MRGLLGILGACALTLAPALWVAGCSDSSRGAPPPPTTAPASGSFGSWAHRYLAADPYTTLIVEVDYVEGHAPAASALQELETRLRERCDKPGGVVIDVDDPIVDGVRPVYSVADVRALELAHRDSYASGTTAVLYLLYLDGSSDQDAGSTGILGYSYTGTSVAMFKETIAHTANRLIPAQEVEAAVLIHEAGHELGLVDAGTPMVTPHEDPEHPYHDVNEDCVMYWKVETTDLRAFLQNGRQLNKEFDAACIADMRANGGL